MINHQTYFQQFIDYNAKVDQLIVQPRMGFSSKHVMRDGLKQIKSLDAPSIGTITIDSFTRTGNFASARKAVNEGKSLNGYPIVSYDSKENHSLIKGIRGSDFPVQVRHGSPLPEEIFKSTIAAGIDAIEGGPVSYCLPYSRVPLNESIKAWIRCSQIYAEAGNGNYHIESFGGCMMGQLCPPSMLIAITVLEALFFKFYGIRSVSVSLAQGTNSQQDLAALKALNTLAEKYLTNEQNWHIVFYTFMGKFPETFSGARALIEESALVAKLGKARRLIVKTVNEAHQIPTIDNNKDALLWAHKVANQSGALQQFRPDCESMEQQVLQEADFLIDMVLNLNEEPGKAISMAFEKGYLDVPYCLHHSNKRLSRARIDSEGNVFWSDNGKIPFPFHLMNNKLKYAALSSEELLKMLSFNQLKYDLSPCFI